MTSTLSTVRSAIVLVLDETGEVRGTETLASVLGMANAKSYVIKSARILQSAGEIKIIPSNGGRGRKTIYKRNTSEPEKRKP